MNQKMNRVLGWLLVFTMMFTSVFSNLTFAGSNDSNENLLGGGTFPQADSLTTDAAVEVGKTYEYSLVKGADEDGLAIQNSGQEVDPTKVGEVHGIKVDASAPGAKFDNVNRASNGDSQVTKGVVLGVPVNGKSTITIVGYQDIEIGITDKEEPAYADKETISCGGGWTPQSITYYGKSESYVYLEIRNSTYIKKITVVSDGVQEEETKVWEKRDFNLTINGTVVTVTGAENIFSEPTITLSDNDGTSIESKTAESASLKLNLGGAVTNDTITDISSSITAALNESGQIVVTFKDAKVKPYTFTFTVGNTYEKKQFSFDFNGEGKTVSVETGAKPTDIPEVALAEGMTGEVINKELNKATLVVDLAGAELAESMITKLTDKYTAAVEGNAIKFTYTESDGSLWTYTLNVVDSSVNVMPEKGKTYTYIFSDGSIVPEDTETPINTIVSEDMFLTINGNGTMKYNNGGGVSHGVAVYDGNSFEVKVAGDAIITFNCCMYSGSGSSVESSVKTGTGTFNAASVDIAGTAGGGTKGEGEAATFVYTGEAADLLFTVKGTGFIHGMSVQNLDNKPVEDNGKIDVWDFGAYALDAEKYNNLLDVDTINSWYADTIVKGSAGNVFAVPTFTAGDLTWNTTAVNNRLRTTNKDLTRYDEGTSASSIKGFNCTELNINGCIYINSAAGGGSFTINTKKDDVVYVYVKMDNENDVINFTKAGASEPTAQIAASTDGSIVKFIVPEDGIYTISDGTVGGGKPRYYRIIREHAKYVNLTGTVTAAEGIPKNYSIIFRNIETGAETEAIPEDGNYVITVAAGYTYQARLANAEGFRISEGVEVKVDDAAVNNIKIDAVTYRTVSGSFTGFEESFDMTNVEIYFQPVDEIEKLSYGKVSIEITEGKYSAKFADNVEYEMVMEGANDYEIKSGNTVIKVTEDTTNDISVAKKAVYDVTGKFVTYDEKPINVSAIKFKNLDDDYVYDGVVAEGGYSVKLREGNYEVVIETEDAYNSASHVVVTTEAVKKDILFMPKTAAEVAYAKDVYVGVPEQENNYETVKDAIEAVNNMNPKPTNESERITIHVAPGVYRAQHILKTPYVSIVSTDPSQEVKLTWYYGIGYKYYSAGSNGYYNELNAFDKFLKNGKTEKKTGNVDRWGGAFQLQSTANDFYAENITFENSFNKYVTEEEILDGVEPSGAESINFDRTKEGVDVYSKAATERAAAMIAEADNAEFYRCSFLSSQDTLYINPSIKQYYKECFIEGMTDYIFGDGQVAFEDCTLNFCGYSDSTTGGYVTATRWDQGGLGYIFKNCKVTSSSDKSVGTGHFGRPWGATSRVYFMNTTIEKTGLINNEGFSDWGNVLALKANYHEYGSKYANGDAVDTSKRKCKVMTLEEANQIKIKDWFGDWTPKNYVDNDDEDDDKDIIYGDINNDRKITALDAAIVLQYCNNKAEYTLTDKQLKAADVDGSEGISYNDVSLILDKALNYDTVLPFESVN